MSRLLSLLIFLREAILGKLVLITNDDGISSPGLISLRNKISEEWDAIVVAPDREQSAASHALTLNRPLRVTDIDERTKVVDGTPTDCVMLSIMGLLDRKPDIVISGINTGANLGDDVIYSGTVAGAAEANLLGIPSVALSFTDPETADPESGADIALKITKLIFKYSLPKEIFLNVNIPSCPFKDFEITSLGRRSYREMIVKKVDPRGRPYYWIAGQVDKWHGNDFCDFAAIERGNVSVTPLHLDMTSSINIEDLKRWNFKSV